MTTRTALLRVLRGSLRVVAAAVRELLAVRGDKPASTALEGLVAAPPFEAGPAASTALLLAGSTGP